MMLNLGCGDRATHARAPWINVDNWPGCEPDIVADITDLPHEPPFLPGTVEAVYLGHVLEHLPVTELGWLCGRFQQMLIPDGLLAIVGPDSDKVRSRPDWAEWVDQVDNGDETHPGSGHLWRSTGARTLELVRPWFPTAYELDVRALPAFWPVFNHIGWQFAITLEDR